MKLRHYILLGALFIVPIISPLLFQTATQKPAGVEVPAYRVTEYHGIKKFPDIQNIHNALYQACSCQEAKLITQEDDKGGITSAFVAPNNTCITLTIDPAQGFATTCIYDKTGGLYSAVPFDELFDAQNIITRDT